MSLPVIYELFESIVGDVSAAMGTTVHFRHGHMLEVVNQVKEMMVDPDIDKRYPLIALRHDIKQKPVNGGVEIDCRLYIVTLSDPKYTAEERYDNIFVPYLRPILEEFIYQLANSGYFEESTTDQVYDKLTFWERLFWGNELVMGNDGNIFSDWVDCIELEFSGLTAFAPCSTIVNPHPAIVTALTDESGEFFYVVFNMAMAAVVSGLEGQFFWYVGGASVAFDSVELLSDGRTYKLESEAPAETGTTITLQVLSGMVQSARGGMLPEYNDYPVVNNV